MSTFSSVQSPLSEIAAPLAPVPPAAMLEGLAGRVRPSGLCLAFLRADGTWAYHDSSAAQFFLRYVIPQAQQDRAASASLRQRAADITPSSPIAIWPLVAGVSAAAFPYVERRQ